MKKTIVLFGSLLLLTTAALAHKTTFGVRLGVASNYLTFKQDDEDGKFVGSNTRPFLAGVAHIQISDQFAIQPNLNLIMKGGMVEGLKINTFHVDVPINFLYTHNGFFAGGGPNFSYGIVGKLDLGDEDVDIYDQEEAGELTLKKFDVGANIILGYTCPNGLSFAGSFTPGLLDVYKGEEDDESGLKAHFKTFAFTIGYMFGGRKK
jgi:hypothetical protein